MTDIKGAVVLVTGAGGGIGRAEALAFARAGARVVVNDVHGAAGKPSAAEAVAEEIRTLGAEAVAAPGSVAVLDDAEGIVWAARARFGRVDVLVNNAGILRDRSLLNMSEAEWTQVMDVHARGSFLMTRAFARALKAQAPAPYAIVNTTSVSGLVGNFGQANYGAAKAAIFGLTRVSSLELGKLGCRVNALAPVALTQMTAGNPRLAHLSADAMGPQHIAPVAVWLGSPLSEGITGRVFGIQGGEVFEYTMTRTASAQAEGGMWTPEALNARLNEFEAKTST